MARKGNTRARIWATDEVVVPEKDKRLAPEHASHMRPDDGSSQIRVGKPGPRALTKAERRKRKKS